MTHDTPKRWPVTPGTFRIAMAMLVLFAGITAARMAGFGSAEMVDYHVFRLAGALTLDGRVTEAYDFATFAEEQARLPGATLFMPWTYPPQFNLVTAALASVPAWLGLLLWTVPLLLAFAALTLRIDRRAGMLALMLVLPAIAVSIRSGQNGLLSACLVALAASATLSGNARREGLSLALLAYKPHLCIGLGAAALFAGRFRTIAIATGALAVILALSTLLLGLPVWTAVAESVARSGEHLTSGEYPLFRMTSVFASALSVGLPSSVSMICQGLFALVALTAVGYAIRAGWAPRRQVALAIFATYSVSPYNYDYDVVGLAIALAIAWPDLESTLDVTARRLFCITTLVVTGWGLLATGLQQGLPGAPALIAPQGLLFAGLAAVTLWTFHRVETRPETSPNATRADVLI
ncbi:glycosyltransferase family 87 protein [Pelagovum pacificum]|uniref:DUF2029 domain-containing protein n=1 Tax=Pelagovum pacificum TaxID=2588711 RepID=A0A5C5GBZ2_9RHOB|nr:glycosyltransferase family 87 protein [Pelagovum pacificum]QQA44586.1 DUF2029 domain-containing protein [Pelagovum pacificum]TNY32302.1 DUF2029 domain-containing protein [Pelagovum pacificum]